MIELNGLGLTRKVTATEPSQTGLTREVTADAWGVLDIFLSASSSGHKQLRSEFEGQSMTSPDSLNGLLTNLTGHVTWDSSADCDLVSYPAHVGVGFIVSSVAAFAVIGNVLVLCTYSRHSSLRTSSNFFIINLTTADLFMSLLDFPMLAASSFNGCWLLGYAGCQIYASTTAIFSLVTINTLAVVSVDRYMAVVHSLNPARRMSKCTSAWIIFMIWLVSLLWSVLPFLGLGAYRLEGMGTSCTFNYILRSYSQRCFFLSLVGFNFFVPLIVIVYSYSQIFAYVKRVKGELRSIERENSSVARRRTKTTAETKTAMAVLLIISIFCTAWTPYVIVTFVGLFGPAGEITPLVSMVPNILAKVSTVSNAIVYALGHKDLRRKMMALMIGTHPRSFSLRATNSTADRSTRSHSQAYEMPTHSSCAP